MKTEIKNIRHVFTLEERDAIGGELARAFGALRGIENEFDQIKSSYKAKTTEQEAKIDRLSTDRSNGFLMRDTSCVVIFRPAQKEKDYFTEEDAKQVPEGISLVAGLAAIGILPALTERMTADDFQQELIEAESKFNAREEIELFKPAEGDRGILVVGRLAGHWFSALRVKIGKLELNERLDSEQPSCKARADAVSTAVKRFKEWSKANLKDLARGFEAAADEVIQNHKERAE